MERLSDLIVYDLITYVNNYYDCISKMLFCSIAIKEFGFSLAEAVEVYNNVYQD